MILDGHVLSGINNIYTVRTDSGIYECRIKGKVLKDTGEVYNPIAAGDFVKFETDDYSSDSGMIVERLERKSEYSRWNKKRNSPQIIAANFDILIIVASVDKPPFRPRFIDRILVMADSDIDVLIVLNKSDYGINEDILKRMDDYKRVGYDYLLTSVNKKEGIEVLKEKIDTKIAVFAGQSGVGKSSLLNLMFTGLDLRTGEISLKHNRGRHTTNYARLLFIKNYGIIDTPGIREIEVFGVEAGDLTFRFPEFIPFSRKCFYQSCLHLEEPECGVKKAVIEGKIHPDRYESYLRILKDISGKVVY